MFLLGDLHGSVENIIEVCTEKCSNMETLHGSAEKISASDLYAKKLEILIGISDDVRAS